MAALPDEKQAENLVAYLDGELDDSGAMTIEQQLATDPQVRRSVERLARTWDLLDLLPLRAASHDFTAKTLTSIRTRAEQSDETSVSRTELVRSPEPVSGRRQAFAKWLLRVVAAFVLLVVAAAGFNSKFLTGSQQTSELLREYPLLKELHHYHDVGSVEFLRELQDKKVFHGQQPPPRQ